MKRYRYSSFNHRVVVYFFLELARDLRVSIGYDPTRASVSKLDLYMKKFYYFGGVYRILN